MGEVFLCPECREPVDLEKEYVVTNRATAATKLNRIYAHVACVRGNMKPIREMSDGELDAAIAELDEHDISMLAAWHASMDVGHPVPNRDFLMGAFTSLGQHRREALKLAAGFRGEEAVDRGVTEERALETVLEWLSPPRLMELAVEAVELYVWDRAGSDN